MFCCFKQKTAYEMRISDRSSDVCSSDLLRAVGKPVLPTASTPPSSPPPSRPTGAAMTDTPTPTPTFPPEIPKQIGREACRERGGQYVLKSVVTASFKKKQTSQQYNAINAHTLAKQYHQY